MPLAPPRVPSSRNGAYLTIVSSMKFREDEQTGRTLSDSMLSHRYPPELRCNLESTRHIHQANPLCPTSQTFTTKKLDQNIGTLRASRDSSCLPQTLPDYSRKTPQHSIVTQAPGTHNTATLRPDHSSIYSTGGGQIMTKSEAHFVPPTIPPSDFLNIMNNYNTTDLFPYLEFLYSLKTLEIEINEAEMVHTPHPHEPQAQAFSNWLCSMLPPGELVPRLRSLRIPERDDFSLLARCVRYTQSYAEREVCWAVHPIHVALIMERTNAYGVANLAVESEAMPDSRFSDLTAIKEFLGLDG